MNVSQVMTPDPACCTQEMGLQDVARMMVDCDCGALPVVDSQESLRVIGIITDRDIVCRSLAYGKNPLQMTVRDCMTAPVECITEDTSLDECMRLMQQNQVRRIPVVDANGCCCGIMAQADVAQTAAPDDAAEVLREISL